MQGICKVYDELKEEKETAVIAIKIGVNAPSDNVEGVLKVLNFIYEQDPSEDDEPFRFGAL